MRNAITANLGLPLALALVLMSPHAAAMASNNVTVNCGTQHVVIKSDYAEGLPPLAKPTDFYLQNHGQTNECRLKSGDVVRVRFGFDYDAIHYSQTSWVSVWFDRRKWLSREAVEVKGSDEPRAASIDVGVDGVSVCTVKGPILIPAGEDPVEQKPECKLIEREGLPSQVDTKEEKSLDATERPILPPQILFGENSGLCWKMAAVDEDTFNVGVSVGRNLWLNYPEGQSYRIGAWSIQNGWEVDDAIDIDNSGTSRHVYHRSEPVNAWGSFDLFVVLDDAALIRLKQIGMTDDNLLKLAVAVWPLDWSKQTDRLSAQKNVGSLVTMLSLGDDASHGVDMPDQWMLIRPFPYKSQTFLLLSQNAPGGENNDLAFIVKPRSNGTFDEICAFKEQEFNF